MMRRVFPFFSLLVIVSITSQPAMSVEPLKAIPSDVAAVVRFQSLDKFLAGINDMMTAIGPPATLATKAISDGLSTDFFELEGDASKLNRKVPAYAAIFAEDNQGPPVVWFVQAASEKALQQALLKNANKVKAKAGPHGFKTIPINTRRSWYYRKIGKNYAYTQQKKLAEKVAKVLDKKAKSIASISDAQAEKLFVTGHVGVFVNAQGMTAKFKNEINQGKEVIVAAIKAIPDEQLGVVDAKKARELYLTLINASFQAVFDAKWVVLQGSTGGDGALGHATIGFKKGSATKKFAAQLPTSQLDNLGLLPPGSPVYYGFELGLKGLASKLTNLSYGSNSDTKAAKAATKLMEAGQFVSQCISFALPNDKDTGFQVTSIEQAKDAKKYASGFAALMKTVGTVKNAVFSQSIIFKEKAEKHKKHSIDRLDMKMKITDPNLAMVQGLFDKMFGGDTLQTRVVRFENLVISASGNNKKFIRDALDNIESGEKVAGLDDAFAKAREKLGENANVLFLINVPQLMLDGIGFVKDVQPFSLIFGQLPLDTTVKAPRSFTGFALKKVKNGASATLFVPVEQPKFILRIFGPLLGA